MLSLRQYQSRGEKIGVRAIGKQRKHAQGAKAWVTSQTCEQKKLKNTCDQKSNICRVYFKLAAST